MPENYTSNLTDSLETLVASARAVGEYEGVMSKLVEKHTLEENSGLTWNEVSFAKLTASALAETDRLDNPQSLTDTNFAITPTVTGIHMVFTDRVKRRISKLAWAKVGQLAANAMVRKVDTDGLLVLDGFTSLAGAGTTLNSGYIVAAAARIKGNATEPAVGPVYTVLHPFQAKDLQDELLAGVGTYAIPEGDTARVYKEGFRLPIAGTDVFTDGNISVDSADDAKGGTFAKMSIVLIEGRAPWKETDRDGSLGGGADVVYLYREYAYGERLAGGTTSAWGFEIYSDATAPTS